MKKLVLLCLLAMCALNVQARDSLISGKNTTHGGFGGPQFGITQINGDTEFVAGGGGAWLVNSRFFLGGRGYGVGSSMKDAGNLDFGYGGLWFGYIMRPASVVNFSADVTLGAGGLADGSDTTHHNHSVSEFFVAEPAVNMRLNLAEFVSAEFGVSYRMVQGSSHAVLDDEALSGLGAHLRVEFGKF